MARTDKSKKAAAKKKAAQKQVARLKEVKKPNKTQIARLAREQKNVKAAQKTIKAESGKKASTKEKKTAKEQRDKGKTAKGKNFFGTNIPLSAVADSGKRDEINARLKADIAAGDWSGANDALFSAAFNTVKGGKGQGNPNVGKVHSGAWKVNKSPLSWAETAINSANDYYPQVDGSVVTFDDKLGALKDGVSSGTWGGQSKGESQPHFGEKPPAGVRGAAPIGVDTSGKQSALRQRGLRDLNTIFGAGTTGGTTGGTGGGRGGFAGDTSGGLLGGQYGGRVGEYQVPNRSFNWQTDPTEQALMASAMGRPDLAQMMLTGQYGPLAGQNYQYGGGQTRINYGPGGAGYGAGAGAGGTGGRLGPLGGAGADTAAAAVVNPDVARQDWWPPGASNARMAEWMRTQSNLGKPSSAMDWYESLTPIGESLAGLRGLFGLGGDEVQGPGRTPYQGPGVRGFTPQFVEDVKARAARTPSIANPADEWGMEGYSTSPAMAGAVHDFPAFTPALTPRAIGAVHDFPTPTISPGTMASPSARLAMDAAAANPYDFGAGRVMTGGAAPFLPYTPTTPVQVGMGTGYSPFYTPATGPR